jgi:hypothetical protein
VTHRHSSEGHDSAIVNAALGERDDTFRSTIVMARHGFGQGEYKYWSYPLPEIVAG